MAAGLSSRSKLRSATNSSMSATSGRLVRLTVRLVAGMPRPLHFGRGLPLKTSRDGSLSRLGTTGQQFAHASPAGLRGAPHSRKSADGQRPHRVGDCSRDPIRQTHGRRDRRTGQYRFGAKSPRSRALAERFCQMPAERRARLSTRAMATLVELDEGYLEASRAEVPLVVRRYGISTIAIASSPSPARMASARGSPFLFIASCAKRRRGLSSPYHQSWPKLAILEDATGFDLSIAKLLPSIGACYKKYSWSLAQRGVRCAG